MPNKHTVKVGQTLDSIGFAYGFFPVTLWDHPENRSLRERRDDMNVLMEGDVVFIPDKGMETESVPAEKRYRFRRRGVPAMLRLQLTRGYSPRVGEPFVLAVNGIEFKGITDDKGVIEVTVPPDAARGTLTVGDDHPIEILIGHLNPLSTPSGVRQRLQNLGLLRAEGNENYIRKAIAAFQRVAGLPETGELDNDTRQRLGELHDSPKLPKTDDERI